MWVVVSGPCLYVRACVRGLSCVHECACVLSVCLECVLHSHVNTLTSRRSRPHAHVTMLTSRRSCQDAHVKTLTYETGSEPHQTDC